jgi:hypothetical protein
MTTHDRGRAADLFRFVSCYAGEADYRHLATGQRYRVCTDDPTATLRSPYADLIPPAVLEDWREYRRRERAEFVAWTDRRRDTIGADIVAQVLAQSYPDVTEAVPA